MISVGPAMPLQRQWSRSLTLRLLVLVMGVLITGIGVIADQATRQMREAMQRELIARVEADIAIQADQLEWEMNNRKRALEQVAAMLSLELANKEAATLQRLLESRPVFNSFFNRGTFIADAQGIVLSSTPLETGRTGISYADRDYMIAALRGGETFAGGPEMDKTLGAPVVVIATPVRLQGRIVGALAGVTDLSASSFLNRFQGGLQGGSGREITLVDVQSGLVVASSDSSRLMQAAKPAAPSLPSGLAKGDDDKMVVSKPVGSTGWLLEMGVSMIDMQIAVTAMQTRVVTAAVGVTLIGVLFALWALQNLLRPLARASAQLDGWNGDGLPFSPALADRPDEIGRLTNRFNRVSEQLTVHSQTLDQSSALLEKVSAMAHVGGWELDVSTERLYWSLETFRIHDLDAESPPTLTDAISFYAPASREIVKAAVNNAIATGKSYDLELELVTALNRAIWVRAQCHPVLENGQVVKLRGAVQDITRTKSDAARISELAFTDVLTSLPNRRLLMDRLGIAMAACRRHARIGALLVIDLDDFKMLNDSYGHFKGDLLLKAVGQDLIQASREGDTVARVGADEFMVLLTDLGSDPSEAVQQARTIAESLLLGLRRGYLLGRLNHYSTASIGVTFYGAQEEGLEDPMKRADLAMVQARKSGGDAVYFFEDRMQALIDRRVELESAMRRGLKRQEFLLHYQPQVVESGDRPRIVGVEALIRWQHPQQGMISPGEFIPVAEESGMILDIGKWVLASACAQLARWRDDPMFSHLSIAVNVSPRQFHQSDFVTTVLQILGASGADPKRLKLELTEGMLVSDMEEVIEKMHALRLLGIGLSLDDFGTGYSSLSYLKRLPLDQIKIDQSFVRDILTDSNDAAIARTIIALADSLGLSIIAEGVETEEQRNFLVSEGCLAYQGYFFCRPVAIQDFELWAKGLPEPS